MKRLAGSLVAAMVASVLAGALTIHAAAPAAAIDDYDGGSYWDENFAPIFADGDGGVSPFDKVYNWIFGDATQGVTVDGNVCTVGAAGCTELTYGYAPSPSGVTSIFGKTASAAGVTVKAGNEAVTAAGMMFNLLGASASQLTIDESTTDLYVQPALPAQPNFLPGTYIGLQLLSWAGTETINTNSVTVTAYGTYQTSKVGSSVSIMGLYKMGYELTCRNTTTNALTTTFIGTSGNSTRKWATDAVLSLTANITTRTTNCAAGSVVDSLKWYQSEAYTGQTAYEQRETIHGATPGGLVGSVESTYVCRKSDGTTASTSSSVPVTGTGSVTFDIPAFSCGADELLVSALVEWVTDTGRETIYDYDAPSWVQDTPAEWQVCGVSTDCELKLYKVVGGSTQYCGQYAVGCPEWWDEDAAGYECRYGPFVVDLNYCAQFRAPGQVSPSGTVKVGTDGTPEYQTPVGKPRSWFDTVPHTKPTTPTTGTPAPAPVPVTPGVGDPSPSSSACFPSGWGIFNPLEWVYRPVTCALTWAFVPRQAVVETQLQTVREDIASKPPFAIIDAGVPMIQGLFGGYTSGSCGFANFWPGGSATLTISCATPAGWSPVYGMAVVAVWAGALWQAVRMVAAGIGNREAG